MKKHLCGEAGCGALLDSPGYCGRHRREKAAAKPFEGAARVIRETPYCEVCGASGKDGAVLEAHHREPPRGDEGKSFDENNLQTLCRPCYRLATAREIGERNRRKGRMQ